MPGSPPFNPKRNDRGESPPELHDLFMPLEIPDHDIRLVDPFGVEFRRSDDTIYDFGDFDPNPDDPDPDIWPLEGYDPGYPAPVDELYCLRNTYSSPHVAWVTKEYLKARYGYDPVDTSNKPSPPARYEPSSSALTLTEDRKEALTRIARLWNGEVVRGQHLLADKCPDWRDFLGDLDQDELRRLVVDPEVNHEFADAFSDHDWYEDRSDVYLRPQWVVRNKVWYAPTQKGRTLINENSAFPSLKGDPFERLRHRFTVGLVYYERKTVVDRVASYHELDEYSVDVASQAESGGITAVEVITGHHNWEKHRATYEKLEQFDSRGVNTAVAFDDRETAYDVMNSWIREGLAELPTGTFNSDPNISWAQEKTEEAYTADNLSWCIQNWTTSSRLWRDIVSEADPAIIKSLDW